MSCVMLEWSLQWVTQRFKIRQTGPIKTTTANTHVFDLFMFTRTLLHINWSERNSPTKKRIEFADQACLFVLRLETMRLKKGEQS